MTQQTRKNVSAPAPTTERRDVRELTAEEVSQVTGGGLLSSPVGFLRGPGRIGNPGIGNPGGPGTIVTP